MKLIFAQGNPGPEYVNSRHNIGFMILDGLLAQKSAPPFKPKIKFQAEISEFIHNDEKIILAKPTTFYNLTGQSISAICNFYRIGSADVFVMHDELALEFGVLRIRPDGSDAGNKGVRSLASHLGTEGFWRLRVGIANNLTSRMDAAAFVLSGFNETESNIISSLIIPEAIDLIDAFLAGTLAPTSLRLIP